MSSYTQRITLENRSLTVFVFKRSTVRHRHCAKHFLSLDESWHALENIPISAHDILIWRKNISLLKCAVEAHSQADCLNFPQCDKLLADYSVVYCDKIAAVLRETAETGAVAEYSDGMRHLYLSSDGVIVISRKLSGNPAMKWNVVTSYVPYENRVKTITPQTVYERFFTALDKALRVVTHQGGSYRYINMELWKNYKSMVLMYGDAR
jgi:hypothetical protein